jgi:septation ring formation regulator EzrA
MTKRRGKAVSQELSSAEFQALQSAKVASAAQLDAQLKALKAEKHAVTQTVQQAASLAEKEAALDKQLEQFCDSVWAKVLKIAANAQVGYATSSVLRQHVGRWAEKMGFTIDWSEGEQDEA